MRGIRLGESGGLERIGNVEIPDPGNPNSGQIRVRIRATSANYHDYLVISRDSPASVGRIPMADGAGIVEMVGDGVEEFAVGDRVVSTFSPTWLEGEPLAWDLKKVPGDGVDGYACEVIVRPATWFTKAPADWSDMEAATLTTAGVTAWRSLTDAHIRAGHTILTMGSGGVAVFAIQIAKAMSAKVIATSSSDEKLERLSALGADYLINYRTSPDWGLEARKITGGRGVDNVIEIGGADTISQSFQAVRVGGHISLVGILAGAAGNVPLYQMLGRQIRLQGVGVGSRRHQCELIAALNAANIRPVIDKRVFSMTELADAFRYLISGRHFGKICVTV